MFRRLPVILLCGCALFTPLIAHASPVVSEVMWMGTDLSSSDEWLEIAAPIASDCPLGSVLPLDGDQLTILNSSVVEVTVLRFAQGQGIPCGGQIIVSRNAASSSRLEADPAFVVSTLSLPNTRLQIRLYDVAGTLLDQADDGVGDPMAGANPSGGVRASMERIDLSVTGTDKINWRTATISRGFDSGSTALGTPGYSNGSIASSSSVSSSSSSTPPSSLPISSPSSSSLSSLFSSSSPLPTSASSDSSMFSSTSSSAIASEASSIPLEESSSSYETASSVYSSASSSSSEVSSITLSSSNESISSQTSSIYVQINYSSISSQPSIETNNHDCEIRINEILANPEGADTDEWIELYNAGNQAIDLSGWTINLSGSTLKFTISNNSGSVLHEKEFMVFYKGQTGLTLSNQGGTVILRHNGIIIDALAYPLAEEGITTGRLMTNPQQIVSFCTQTPGQPNASAPPNVSIELQSGEMMGEEEVTANFQARFLSGTSRGAECFWDYQDGFTSASCNPPSHTFIDPGHYSVHLHVRDYCSNTVEQYSEIYVYEKANSTKKYQSSSASSAASLSIVDRAKMTTQSYAPSLIIASVLPNPIGSDKGKEWIDISNRDIADADIDGWVLRDEHTNKEWTLTGSLRANATMRLHPNERGWSLVNASGALLLLDPSGKAHSSLRWDKAKESVVYTQVTATEEDSLFATVKRIIDGDTIEVQTDAQSKSRKAASTIVRLRGIDAPEMYDQFKRVSSIGIMAKNFIKSLIENKKVVLKFDTEKIDIYGRTLAYVWLGDEDIQRKLLSAGLARVIEHFPFSLRSEYKAIEASAGGQKLGIWANTRYKRKLQPLQSSSSSEVSLQNTGPIYISEVYPYPKAGEKEWIELYNPNPFPVSMSGWTVDDVQNGGSTPQKFKNTLIIQSGSYMMIEEQYKGIKLNNNSDEIHLLSPDLSFKDFFSYTKAKQLLSFARSLPVRQESTVCSRQKPTPSSPNTCTPKVAQGKTAAKQSRADKRI